MKLKNKVKKLNRKQETWKKDLSDKKGYYKPGSLRK